MSLTRDQERLVIGENKPNQDASRVMQLLMGFTRTTCVLFCETTYQRFWYTKQRMYAYKEGKVSIKKQALAVNSAS